MTATLDPETSASLPRLTLPNDVREVAARHLSSPDLVVGFAPFDVTQDLQYTQGVVLLTDTQLLIVERGELTGRFDLQAIEEAGVEEGLGVDRLRVVLGGKLAGVARYSRRHRTLMQRLNRKLQRRLPPSAREGGKDKGKEAGASPAVDDAGAERSSLFEAIERQAEQQDVCPKCGHLIPSYAEGVCPRCLHQRKMLLRLLDVAKPYRKTLNIALALTLVHCIVISCPVYLRKHFVDEALVPVSAPVGQRVAALAFWGALMIAVIILSEWLGGLRMSRLSTVGTLVTADLRQKVYGHLHSLSLKYFNKRRSGSLITRVTSDTDRLWDFIVFGSVNLLRDGLMMIVTGGIMLWLNWRLAIVALLPVPVVAVLSYLRSRKMHAQWSRVWTYWSRITGVIGDALPGVKTIKAFANEPREVSRFKRRNDDFTSREIEANQLWWTLQPLVSGIMQFGGFSVLLVGGLLMIYRPGTTTLGDLLAFGGAVWQFYGPVMELVNANRMITRSASSAARVFEILDTPPDIFDRKGAFKPDHVQGRIELRGVWFSYEGAQPALRNVNLTIEPGEMIGLCGPSGAGKSTFVNLIPRFYDVTDGQILIDGVDVRDWDIAHLRKSIGTVLQESYLFAGTVADNIRYAKPDATLAEVIEAARAANAHDFIVGFPDGYDTYVGERGQSLSGGERQRISIARAILHNPRILILDEATSSVDTETEKQIQQALDRLVKGRTTIAIAHRLSTLTNADRIIVLERGRVAEEGLHQELAEKPDGVYAKLVRTQKELGSMVAVAG